MNPKPFDIMEFFRKFDSAFMYEQFEEDYNEFNEKALKGETKVVREWYDNIENNVKNSSFKYKNTNQEWKVDFLDAWRLIRYYREWLEIKERDRLKNDSKNEKKIELLEAIINILINHQGKKKEEKYRVLTLCVDVFLAYGGNQNGLYLTAVMWQMLKDAESDPECKAYYGEPARSQIVDRAYRDLGIRKTTGDKLEKLLKLPGNETQKAFIRKLIERGNSNHSPKNRKCLESQNMHTDTETVGNKYTDKEFEPHESGRSENKGKKHVVLFIVLGCVVAALLAFALMLYFLLGNGNKLLNEIRQNPGQNHGEVQQGEVQLGDGEGNTEADIMIPGQKTEPEEGDETPDSRDLEEIDQKFDSLQSVVASLSLAGDLTVGGEDTDVIVQMGINSTADPLVVHRTVSAGILSGGDVQAQNMEIYEEGSDVHYRTGNGNDWIVSENGSGKEGTGAAIFQEISERLTEFQISDSVGGGGSPCYILEGVVSGTSVATCIPEVANVLFEESALSSMSALPQQDVLDGQDVECVIIVNAETLLPESAAFDLTEAMQAQNASRGNTVRKYTAEISYLDYNSLNTISVPSENQSGLSGIIYSSEGEDGGEY